MIYLLISIVLFCLLLIYFKIADKYNIIDKPNNRSSHTEITIRGGGIIFPVALIAYTFFAPASMYLQIGGILLISFISFWDDVKNLPNRVRLLVHLISVSIIIYTLGVFDEWPIWVIISAYILIIGTINAYNFMDGINGITGLYSLVALVSLYVLNIRFNFTDNDFIIFPIIACLVFLFFNFRKKAKCFAGDVGSVTIGIWIITILLTLIIFKGELRYIFFLAVYGVDSVLTIIHRLILKQNIFQAHRLHLYQILANERKISHLTVAVIYAIVQALINAFLIYTDFTFITSFLLICVPLGIVYIVLKGVYFQKQLS